MFLRFAALLLAFGPVVGSHAADKSQLITYSTLPMGSPNAPLVLRTYLPDPDVDAAVFANHFQSAPAARYLPTRGEDVPGEPDKPIKGVAAAIGVNHGPELSYAFDTIEGRLLYAWKGGFVDMFPYWGDQQGGNRVGNNYVPRLVGTLFYKAAGKHPVEVNGRSVSELGKPRFVGYDLVQGQPVFAVKFGDLIVRTRVQPLAKELGYRLEITSEPTANLSYRSEDSKLTVRQDRSGNALHVTVTGTSLGEFAGYPRRMNFTAASIANGEQLYRNYNCMGCHSTDGSLGHGPTWAGLYDTERTLIDGSKVKVDEAYLLESIKTPNAKIAQNFAPNFMPPYVMGNLEYESLILFIKSLRPE
ncbi:MAG: cytochrome c [Opitutaceae bacterium]